MKTNNWKKVSKILVDCLEIETSERQKFLDESNISADIRAEVESFLAFEEEAGDLMSYSAVEFLKDSLKEDSAANALVGQKIGVYQIISELGYGGMGAVYLAERTDGKFEQKVALKLLKREMNTAALRRRFSQEREILASLQHPNIAGLLDAGTTDDKIPYLAMEYVEGLPIDDYCSKHRLNIEQRLDLFREVCAAVDFAHRNLVVHRDLKPSNILVTENGTPKLLDFGISKILSAEFEQLNTATVTKMGVMTPSYASPEQLQNKSVTTATDVYSLGIILYELLSGHRPFESKESDIKEIYKAVIELDPPLPSRISDSGFGISDSSGANTLDEKIADSENATAGNSDKITNESNLQTNPKSQIPNPKSLSGDLDNIILKALRKEPERRYSSAENLSEDIKRHLRGLPVTARPNTFSYRTSKFVSRNKASVFAGFLIFLTIIGGIVATLWQARVAQAERQVAQTEREKAERRFNDVRQLANSFLFDLSPKIEKLPGSTEARKELVSLALKYLDNLSKEAGNDSELQRELAAAYEKVGDVQGNPNNPNLGDTKGALESYDKALKIREILFDKQPENLIYENDLVQNYKVLGEIHSKGGDYEKGTKFLEKALEIREKIFARNPNDYQARAKLAEMIVARGHIPFYEGQNKKAIEYYSRANKIYEELHKENPSDSQIERHYANTFVSLGEAYGWDDDLKNGEINLDKALSILIELGEKYPNDQPIQRSLVLAYLKTASNYGDNKKEKRGVELYEKGIETAKRISEADPQNVQSKRDLAIITRKLAELLSQIGKNEESLKMMNVVLDILKDLRANDPNNNIAIYDVANAQFAAGETYLELKDYKNGIKILEEAKAGFEKDLSINPDHTNAARTLAFTIVGIGSHQTQLAETENRRENLQKGLENKRKGLEMLYKLKNEGKWSEYDDKYLLEIENEIKEIESKSGK